MASSFDQDLIKLALAQGGETYRQAAGAMSAQDIAAMHARTAKANSLDALQETIRHNKELEGISHQQADTNEMYRQAEQNKMDQEARNKRLEILLKGGGGGGGAGTSGGGMSSEAQKASNLVDVARNSLNETERLAKENPKTAAAVTAMQSLPMIGGPLANMAAGIMGGDIKKVRDARAASQEAFQNLYTGASASGEQVPSFRGFSGPGAGDILSGNVEGSTNAIRDTLNAFQQRSAKKQTELSPEVLDAAGLSNDPVAQLVLKQRQDQAQAEQMDKMSKIAPEDQAKLDGITKNPSTEEARSSMQELSRKYGENTIKQLIANKPGALGTYAGLGVKPKTLPELIKGAPQEESYEADINSAFEDGVADNGETEEEFNRGRLPLEDATGGVIPQSVAQAPAGPQGVGGVDPDVAKYAQMHNIPITTAQKIVSDRKAMKAMSAQQAGPNKIPR